jgi:hypothetical protein
MEGLKPMDWKAGLDRCEHVSALFNKCRDNGAPPPTLAEIDAWMEKAMSKKPKPTRKPKPRPGY